MTRVDLYVVRHGRTRMNEEGRLIGHESVSLSENGKRDVERTVRRLKGTPFDAVYTSDLSRAKETADRIVKGLNLDIPVVGTFALREVDFGEYTGKKKATVKREKFKRDSTRVHPGGESYADVRDRVMEFLGTLEESTVLLVTHSGCIRIIHAEGTGKRLPDALKMDVPHDSVLTCVVEDGRFRNTVFL